MSAGGPMPRRARLLREAEALVCGARQDEYGPPAASFGRAARIASVITGQAISAVTVAAVLLAVKLARIRQSPRHEDSYRDGAGYLALMWELVADAGLTAPSPMPVAPTPTADDAAGPRGRIPPALAGAGRFCAGLVVGLGVMWWARA